MRRTSLLQTVPHSENNLGDEEESLSQTVPHSEDYLGDEEDNIGDEEDNLGDEEDKFITNSTTLRRQFIS
jgi:hypothetical protein